MRIGSVWAIAVGSLALGACTQGVTSERVVQRNLPGESKAASVQEPNVPAAPTKPAPASAGEERRITSQDVEKELNRLEAELGQRR